ncbi:hypothetical protein V4V48_004347 [Vibrio mimicus]
MTDRAAQMRGISQNLSKDGVIHGFEEVRIYSNFIKGTDAQLSGNNKSDIPKYPIITATTLSKIRQEREIRNRGSKNLAP